MSRAIEFSPDKMLVCVNDDEFFYMIDRTKKVISHKIRWHNLGGCPNSCNFEMFKMPGFNVKTFPYVLLRDDYGLKIFNVVSRRLIHLKEALYTSQSGYKTIDLIS